MLRLLVRRAGNQLPLLVAVVALVTIGATLLGVCALLLTVSQDRALNQGLARARADDVSVTAFVVDVPGLQTAAVAADTRAAMASALAPLPITSTETWASSVARPLVDRPEESLQLAYFSGIDRLTDRARLITGRLPRAAGSHAGGSGSAATAGALEAVLLESTARRLGVGAGDRVRLGPENTLSNPGSARTVEVVGIVQPMAGSAWDRDPLRGAGYDPAHLSGLYAKPFPAFGPFILDPADLWSSGATIDSLQVTVQPDLSNSTEAALDAAVTSIAGVDPRLKGVLGERVGNERVVSALPATLSRARFQQDVTRSTVLVVVLLGTALSAAALGLAARLMVSLRSGETALFSAMGAGRAQLAGHAATEALTLAAVATVLAVPLSSLAYIGLTHLPRLAGAGLAAPLTVTGTQIATVLGGALLLATVLVIPALRLDPAQVSGARGRLELLARSGADLLLLGLAGAGWWQLRAQPAGASGTDAVRVVAPVLCLLAGAAVAPRLVALPLRLGERWARTSTGLVLPLAVLEAARRPRTVAAGLLLALAAAAGTFGLAFGSTWERSQQDQAATQVGTDLALSLTSPVLADQAGAVAAATGGTVSAVTDRNVSLGSWMGDASSFPRLLAVDARQAGALLRSRLPDGKTWTDMGALMAPDDPVSGPAPATASRPSITLNGTVPGTDDLQVVARLVVQDPDGLRTVCTLAPVPLDGRRHARQLCTAAAEGSQIIAAHLAVRVDPTVPWERGRAVPDRGRGKMALEMSLPTAVGGTGGTQEWTSSPLGEGALPISSADTTATATGATTVLRTDADLNLARFSDIGVSSLEVVITPFEAPSRIAAVVSQRMADELQLGVGDRVSVTVATTEVPVIVAAVVPTLPSAPGEVALLVDADALSRRLIVHGELDPPVDALWVGEPTRAGGAARVEALSLGSVITRAGVTAELSSGPLRIGLPAALFVLVPAVILLVLAGTLMYVAADLDARAVQIARLRGLGLTRRDIRRAVLAQHGGILALLLGCGAAVGVLTSFAVAPLLVRSDLGAAPTPPALASWPWSSESALLAVLLLGSLAAVAVVVTIQLRRADVAYLRVGA